MQHIGREVDAVAFLNDLHILGFAVVDHELEAALQHVGDLFMDMLMEWNLPLLGFGKHHFGIHELFAVCQNLACSIAVDGIGLNLLVFKKHQ
ncbi:hypothetical protein D3C75_1134870 [compost metagenome]